MLGFSGGLHSTPPITATPRTCAATIDPAPQENGFSSMHRILGAIAVSLVLTASGASTLLAAAADYAFSAANQPVAAGDGAVIAVRLVNETTGKLVENAVIFQTRLDMAPDGMGGMTSPVTVLGESEPGVYRFKADLGMAGRWALTLAAKVPGEQETVRGEVVVVAAK